jgi:hypothetical protein
VIVVNKSQSLNERFSLTFKDYFFTKSVDVTFIVCESGLNSTFESFDFEFTIDPQVPQEVLLVSEVYSRMNLTANKCELRGLGVKQEEGERRLQEVDYNVTLIN